MRKASGLIMVLIVLIVGCMPQAQGTRPPPLTLTPPPTLTFVGDCTVSRDLSNWLEFSTFYAGEFVRLVSEAAAKSAAEMYDDVMLMGRMRNDFSKVAAPDCAEAAQQMIVGTMTHALDGFQAFVNQDTDNLGNTVPEVLSQFDQIIALQNDLTARLETQLQSP